MNLAVDNSQPRLFSTFSVLSGRCGADPFNVYTIQTPPLFALDAYRLRDRHDYENTRVLLLPLLLLLPEGHARPLYF